MKKIKKLSPAIRRINNDEKILTIINGKESYIFTLRQFIAGYRAKLNNTKYIWKNDKSLRPSCIKYYANRYGQIQFMRNMSWSQDVQNEAIKICNKWQIDPKTITDIASVTDDNFCLNTALSVSNWVRKEPIKRVYLLEYRVYVEYKQRYRPDSYASSEYICYMGTVNSTYGRKTYVPCYSRKDENKFQNIADTVSKKLASKLLPILIKNGVTEVKTPDDKYIYKKETTIEKYTDLFGIENEKIVYK